MKQTQNYQLNQWEKTDRIKMEDFNGDNSKVDAALKTLAGQVAGKASSSTVSSLSTKVNTKAAQSDLTAAVNRVTALESGKAEKTALAAEQTAREALATKEAADVAALRSENYWVKVADTTLSANSTAFSCPLVSVGNYAELRCLFTLVSDGYIYFDMNGGVDLLMNSGTYRTVSMLSNRCEKGVGGSIHIIPVGSGDTAAIFTEASGFENDGTYHNLAMNMITVSVPYAQLSSIDLSSNFGTIQAGARMRVYGLKK